MGGKKKTQVDEIIAADVLKLPPTMDLVREFIRKSYIETHKEEGFVMKQVLQGKNPNQIIKLLRRKHPGVYFDHDDFNRFLERNKEIRSILEKENKISARRFKAARADVEELMNDLMLFNKELVRDLAKKEDATNLVASIRTLNQTIMNYSKISGYLDDSDVKNVNIVNLISDKYEGERLKDRIHRADFKEEELMDGFKKSKEEDVIEVEVTKDRDKKYPDSE